MIEDDYDDDKFEEDGEQQALPHRSSLDEEHQAHSCGWKTVLRDEIELGEQLGGGSVGLVYRGTYQGKQVALKTLFDRQINEAMTREYVDELLVLSRLRHPNIVHFYGAGVPPQFFYVMELCQRSLFDLLHNCQRPIPTRERVAMALDVSRAMAYLHSRIPPILHRDLKSLNLLLAKEDGPIKLCDFGLARTTVTSAGTPAYMAPELLQGLSYGPGVDIYAYAVVLWEIFSRDIPFLGFSASEISGVIVSGGRPKVPRGIDPDIDDLICRCWSQDPLRRPPFQEVEDFVKGLLSTFPQATELEGMDSGDCLDELCRK